ncbi:uncharacterized protein UBRO_20058 [Ustilago bromivora]|uniref:Uncharacterized protein n=1 Tax=Ustilago bromivora TaxID=307758 RepID=A0A1K0G545_9BASI|nr:uncharacterized protein UBRO_20058 [Ustilago bromivora]
MVPALDHLVLPQFPHWQLPHHCSQSSQLSSHELNTTGPLQSSTTTGPSQASHTTSPPQASSTIDPSPASHTITPFHRTTSPGPLPELITTTVPSLPAPTQPALTHTPVPILTTTPVVPINNFVTHLDLASSIGELHQFLQYKITNAFHKVVGMFPPTQQGKGSHPPHNEHIPLAPPAPAFPARLGEYQASVTYPWLLPDLIDKVHQDTLTAYDLPKLANPSWPGTPAQEDPVVIEGFLVVKAPSTSASNCQFIKAIPNFSMFG